MVIGAVAVTVAVRVAVAVAEGVRWRRWLQEEPLNGLGCSCGAWRRQSLRTTSLECVSLSVSVFVSVSLLVR